MILGKNRDKRCFGLLERRLIASLCLLISFPWSYFSPTARAQDRQPLVTPEEEMPADVAPDETVIGEGIMALAVDSIAPTVVTADDYGYDESGRKPFNPSPARAVWLSALCPGLGQIYNRRYWKLPIVIGGFMGLGYATNWNNNLYEDYARGYQDLMDNDPSTKSYMDFFPPTVDEGDLDHSWLERTFKARKDYARRNRDLCIIGLVALYALCILDAYVDASLTHFDVTPDLSIDWSPALIQPQGHSSGRPSLGLNWALTF